MMAKPNTHRQQTQTRLGERFSQAFEFAAVLHREQVRKDGTTPYIAHLMAVCAFVLEHGGSEDQAIAALLHDSLEDQSEHFPGGRNALTAEIRTRFGEDVLAIVNACTDDHFAGPQFLPILKSRSWHKRKQGFLESLETAPEAALLVIAADKLHNAARLVLDYDLLGEAVWKRFHVSDAESQLNYYARLAAVLGRRLPGPLTEQLQAAVDTLDRKHADNQGA